MSSFTSGDHKMVCSICRNGQGQPLFTTNICAHSFHSACFWSLTNPQICPVCHADISKDGNVPFRFPTARQQYYATQEPLQFSDDEPLLDSSSSSAPSNATLENIHIKAIPERPAVNASESVPEFSILVGIKAPSLSDSTRESHRAPIDLVMVLDVSASMRGQKIELVKQAVGFVVDNLGPSDRLSIVSFEAQAMRVLRLIRMTEAGREEAKRAVNSLEAIGLWTNTVEGLKKGVRVLEERHQRNPVAAIFFLSDGNDNVNNGYYVANQSGRYYILQLLPLSICPINGATATGDAVIQQQTFPVHAFGFGADHNPVAMHAIAEASDGTFSFIETYDAVQEAFASCIGGLLTVVAQDLRLTLRSSSEGVEIKSIPSVKYASQSSEVTVRIGDLYADEEKEFLVNLSVPALPKSEQVGRLRWTSLLDITCSYKDIASKRVVLVEGDLVEIRRPKSRNSSDSQVNLEVDRQRNRLFVAEAIAAAQQMADTGNLQGARSLLSKSKDDLLVSASWKAGDTFSRGLAEEIDEITQRMRDMATYKQSGRAFMLSGMCSHSRQRATTRGNNMPGASLTLVAYATPNMAVMVAKSLKVKQEIKEEQEEDHTTTSAKRVKKT